CFNFEPIIREWKETLPEHAYFRPVPAFFGGSWGTHGQLFYPLESMGKLEETHAAIFQAIHNQGERLADANAMVRLLMQYGVDEAGFRDTGTSPGVQLKMKQPKQPSFGRSIIRVRAWPLSMPWSGCSSSMVWTKRSSVRPGTPPA